MTYGFRLSDTEASHATRMLYMWTATNFHRVIPNSVDFDQVAVTLTEEGQRSLVQRLLQGHHLYGCLKVTLNLLVDDLLDLSNLLSSQLPGM
jgi:hypothetical protein